MKAEATLFKRLNKKRLYGILIIGVLVLAFSAGVSSVEKKTLEKEEFDYIRYVENLEKGLGGILNRIHGVSEVEVMITLESGFEYVPAYELEKEQLNANSNENQKVIILKKSGGSEEAFVIKERFPEIQGVLVIAKGVENIETEQNIVEAVKAVFNISSKRIKVLEK